MSYKTITVSPLTPHIGAEIGGIDLTQALSDRQVQELHDALTEYLVIFFRDQPIDFEAHKTLGRHFGELHIHSGVAGLQEHPEIVAIHTDAESTFFAGDRWHSDLSCDPVPPMGSILHLHTVPPVGGDTFFANMYAAYGALSDGMKTYLEGLTATHDGARVFAAITDDPSKRFPRSVHPVVRTHPVTKRKALFVNEQYTEKINELPAEEGKAVLDFLVKHCTRPEFTARFRWTPHTIAFWDNRAAQHLAIWDYFPQTRSGYRVSIVGDKPC